MRATRAVARALRQVAAVALLGFLLLSNSASAHSNLIDTIPAPERAVGGEVNRADLEFTAGVSNATITLIGPDGVEVPGEVTQPASNELRYLHEPLQLTGQYELTYELLSEDGDTTSGGFVYVYDPTATAVDYPSEGGSNALVAIIGLAVAVAVAVGLAVAAARMRKARLAEAADDQAD